MIEQLDNGQEKTWFLERGLEIIVVVFGIDPTFMEIEIDFIVFQLQTGH